MMSAPQPISNHRRGLSLSLAGFVLTLLTPLAAQAATYVVNNGGDSLSASCPDDCTLRAAIQAANATPNEDDTILLPDDLNVALTLSGTGEDSAARGDLDIFDTLTISGETAGGRNIINANAYDRVFHVFSDAWVVFQNISIRNGAVTNKPGAGIYVSQSATAELNNVELRANTVTYNPPAPGSDINTSQLQVWGGGIHVDTQATAIIDSSDILENTAPANGGVSNSGRTEIRKSLVHGNNATGEGGPGVNDLFSNGGGVGNLGGYLAIGNSTISGNSSNNQGGGIYITNQGLNFGSVIITNSAITGNDAALNGGGIANLGPATVNNSVVSNNIIATNGNGAGIYNHAASATMDVVNSTISGNTGAYSGGGIFNSRDMTLDNVTIYDNQASNCDTCGANASVGGNELAMFRTSPSNAPNLAMSNTIIADGNNSDVNEPACAGETALIRSLGNSMSSDSSCNLTKSLDQNDVTTLGLDPALTTSIDIDGNTVEHTAVHLLQAASPAIDTGTQAACPLVDQRFLERPVDGNGDGGKECDIGAVESGATKQRRSDLVDIKVTITDSPDPAPPNRQDAPLTYVITVTNQYVDNSANGITLFVNLPTTYVFANINTVSTGSTPSCTSPDGDNEMTCTIANLPGLGRAEFFISGVPTQEGTITIEASALATEQDAFQRNNLNITENTDIDSEAGCVTNFSCTSGTTSGGGGGGAPNPAVLLLLSGIALLVRRRG